MSKEFKQFNLYKNISKSKNDFNQFNLEKEKKTLEDVLGIQKDKIILKEGNFQSKQFAKKKKGWSISDDGDAWFRNLNVYGGSQGGQFRVVDTEQNIQKAIDEVYNAGGGNILLQNGIHKPKNNIILYSNIYLIGQNSESTIIDFENNAYGIIIQGSNAYTTGTISATTGSTTITGSGTTFTTDMIGQRILIKGLWYPIVAVADATHLTIAIPYSNVDVSGYDCVIASVVEDAHIETLTIKNSTGYAFKQKYANEVYLFDINIQASAYGMYCEDSSNTFYQAIDLTANAYGLYCNNMGLTTLENSGSVYTTTGDGFSFNNCYGVTINGLFALNSDTNGISFDGCDTMGCSGLTVVENGAKGIELVSDNNNILINLAKVESNSEDGIKLTESTDNCIITNNFLKDNGGYGINIADSTCDNNSIMGNIYANNTSGDFADNGTNTLSGWSGTFTNGDGDTVTVKGGIITNIS